MNIKPNRSINVVKATYDCNSELRCIPVYQDEEGMYHNITEETLDKLYQTQVVKLESEITTLKQKLRDSQSAIVAVLADNEELQEKLRIEAEACKLLNKDVQNLVVERKSLRKQNEALNWQYEELMNLRKQNRKYREALEYYADEEHLNANYPMDVARQALEDA